MKNLNNKGGDKRGKGVEMRGNGGGVEVGVIGVLSSGWGSQRLGGGSFMSMHPKGRGGSLVLRTVDEFIIYYFT